MSNYFIRKLDIEDYNNGYLKLLEQLTDVGDITQSEFARIFHTLSPNIRIMVLVNNITKKIIGTGTLVIEQKFIHKCSPLGHIEDIVIDNKYRGKGYGNMMLNYLLKLAKDIYKCYKVRLVCNESNVGFYEKLNFTKEGYEMCQRF